jgi:hypothetical protein
MPSGLQWVRRIIRWKPKTYVQFWLFAAFDFGWLYTLGLLIPGHPYGLIFCSALALLAGIAGSVRLHYRRSG